MKCNQHPKYKGIYKPRADCQCCRDIFKKAEATRKRIRAKLDEEYPSTGYGGSDPENYCGGY